MWENWMNFVEKLDNIYIDNLKDIEIILNLIKTKNIKIIIPCSYKQMKFISNHQDKLKEIKLLCCDNYSKINTFHNKANFINFMIKNKLDAMIPKVYTIKNNGYIKHYNDFKDDETYIVKKITCVAGQGSYLSIGKPDLENKDNMIVQKYIKSSTEYSGNLLVINGSIIHSIYYKVITENDNYIQHGRMKDPIRIMDFDKNIQDDISKILSTINFTGFVCVDFKIVNNQLKIFEINPRLGGTVVYNGLPEMLDSVNRL